MWTFYAFTGPVRSTVTVFGAVTSSVFGSGGWTALVHNSAPVPISWSARAVGFAVAARTMLLGYALSSINWASD